MNLHKYETRNRHFTRTLTEQPVLQLPPSSQDYIDDLDLELLRRRQKLENVSFKQPIPKWMNIAWDAFRILDNHSKSMIFMMPDDSNPEEYQLYLKRVQKPLSLETIRVSSFFV